MWNFFMLQAGFGAAELAHVQPNNPKNPEKETLSPAAKKVKKDKELIDNSAWLVPVVMGFFEQSSIDVKDITGSENNSNIDSNSSGKGGKLTVTVIARRSRYYAGARFLRRGLDSRGNVANEVLITLITLIALIALIALITHSY